MILDRLVHASRYQSIHPRLWQGLQYLQQTPLADLPLGRHEIDGYSLYALVQEYPTRTPDECRYEAHRQYIDIQTLASGAEGISWAHLSDSRETIPYDDTKDVTFFSADGSTFVLTPGMFAIFFPQDVHRPCLQLGQGAEPVKKVVLKVSVT